MNCSKCAFLISSALKANTKSFYEKSLVALGDLLTESVPCHPHTKIVSELLASSGDLQTRFKHALDEHKLVVRKLLFNVNIDKEQKKGNAFIKIVLETFPGEPATLADRIFEAADTNPDAMQLVAMYGRTPEEIATSTMW